MSLLYGACHTTLQAKHNYLGTKAAVREQVGTREPKEEHALLLQPRRSGNRSGPEGSRRDMHNFYSPGCNEIAGAKQLLLLLQPWLK